MGKQSGTSIKHDVPPDCHDILRVSALYIVFYSPVVAKLKGTCPLKSDRDTQEADSTTVSLAIDNPKAWAEPHTMEGNRLPKGRKPQLECEINVYSKVSRNIAWPFGPCVGAGLGLENNSSRVRRLLVFPSISQETFG